MKIIGTVEDIIFRNDANNYSVVHIDSNNTLVTVVGNLPELNVGQTIEVDGEITTNTRFGEQFTVREIKLIEPNTKSAIAKYLGSGLIKGVGPVTAEKIVSTFGMDTLTIMELDPMRLATIKGISKSKAQDIASAFSEMKVMQESIMFLQGHGITTNMSLKIFSSYKAQTIQVVQDNPYKLVEDVDGIGFLTADHIAEKMNIDARSEYRVRAGIMHCLNESSDKEGHTFIPQADLINATRRLLSFEKTDDNIIEKTINILALENVVKAISHNGSEIVMKMKYYFIEKYIASKLTTLSHNCYDSALDYSSAITHYEKINNVELNPDQKDAVTNAITSGVSIVTGGPGTGKTTIIKCIIDLFEQEHKKILLLAPTGRAAKRLNETSNRDAKTIHRALEMAPSDTQSYFNRNERNPFDADAIVVDEMSMVDVTLFSHFLKAVKPSAQLVLVGDKDQLPSVSAGNVLKDLIESQKLNTTYLTRIYRQNEKSLIVSNAHLINNSEMPIIDNNSVDFFFESEEEVTSASEKLVDLVSDRLPTFCHTTPNKIQVLAPMKVGACGIDNLNKKLQERLNPYRSGFQIHLENTTLRVGDKIMQIANNYDMTWSKFDSFNREEKGEGVFNGDIGYITHIAPNTYETTVNFDDGRISVYTHSDLYQLTLAYAITIHKSQGCEFDYVVIPIVAGAPIILTRNLLYTAITRAKKLVVLVGTKQNLSRMVKNNYTTRRYTMLKYFLKDKIV